MRSVCMDIWVRYVNFQILIFLGYKGMGPPPTGNMRYLFMYSISHTGNLTSTQVVYFIRKYSHGLFCPQENTKLSITLEGVCWCACVWKDAKQWCCSVINSILLCSSASSQNLYDFSLERLDAISTLVHTLCSTLLVNMLSLAGDFFSLSLIGLFPL